MDAPTRSDYEAAVDAARIDAAGRRDAAVTIHCKHCNEALAVVTDTHAGLLWQQQDRRIGRDLLAQVLEQHDSATVDFIVGDLKRWQRQVRADHARLIDWCGAPDDDWHDGSPLLVAHCEQQWIIDVPRTMARCRQPREPGTRASRHRRVNVADIATPWTA